MGRGRWEGDLQLKGHLHMTTGHLQAVSGASARRWLWNGVVGNAGRKAGQERTSRMLSLKCPILKANSTFYFTIRIKAYYYGSSLFSTWYISTDYLVRPPFLKCLVLQSHNMLLWVVDWCKCCHPSWQIFLPFCHKVSFHLWCGRVVNLLWKLVTLKLICQNYRDVLKPDQFSTELQKVIRTKLA